MAEHHDHEPSDCEAALAEIYTFLDGELTDEKRGLIASHLDGCNPCFEAYDFEAELRAVRGGRMFLADGNQYFNRPGPRLVESLEILAEILHPAEFPARHRGTGWERYHAEPEAAG